MNNREYHNTIFYAACFGFGTGVLFRSLFYIPWLWALGAGCISLALIFIFSFVAKTSVTAKTFPKNPRAIFIFIFLFAASGGILRFHIADKPASEIFQNQINKKISLSGSIAEQPVQKENETEIVAAVEENNAQTKIILFAAAADAPYHYGDNIQFSGKLEPPKNFLTEQNKTFDYINYLKKDGIRYVMRRPEITVLSSGNGNIIKRLLFSAEEKLAASLNASIPAPESLIARALILGERASFSQELRQQFVATGLIHIVTISGYHVALVAEWIMRIFGFLPLPAAASAGIFAIIFYVVMTGGAQSAIRAGVMASLALLARITNRPYDAGRGLALAGAGMILLNPFILVFDVSFQLSFLATVAVIFFAPRLERYFFWISWKWLRDIVSITAAAYLFVLPFVLYQMGTWSLVAIPANFAILPFIPATMIAGFITAFAGLASPLIAFLPGKIAYVLLWYERTAVAFFAALPFASLTVPNFPFAITLIAYALLVYYLFADAKPRAPEADTRGKKETTHPRFAFLAAAIVITVVTAGFFAWSRYESNRKAEENLAQLLANPSTHDAMRPFTPDAKTKSEACAAHNALPDHECTPGAVFPDATRDTVCVRGYTKSVRKVSTKLRKTVYAEYGVPYPQPRGAYEVDHLIPLALGGSNDIANLWTEAADPAPGFHEKDIVEVFLQQEVCRGRTALPSAQRQIAQDWRAVFNNLTPEEILAIKKKYGAEQQ